MDQAGHNDPLAVGWDELSRATEDLSQTLKVCPDCRVEIALAWACGPTEAVADGVILATRIVGHLNRRT